MKKCKFYELNPINVDNKTIIPIVNLKVLILKNTFINIDYEVVAFKIIENNHTYFKNITLDQQDLNYVSHKF